MGEPCALPGTLAPCSPQHCLLGWDVLPPKSDRSSAPKSLDLWSCVSSKAQHQQLSASGPSHVVWSRVPQEGQTSWVRARGQALVEMLYQALPFPAGYLPHLTHGGNPNS